MKNKVNKITKETLQRTKDAAFVAPKKKADKVNTGSPFTSKDKRSR